MKRESQILPSRQATIYAATRRMLDETNACIRKFGMAVAESYFDQTAVDRRQVKFRWGVTIDELCKAEKHNAQVITRYMDGTLKVLPADLEDAWICALPASYRSDLERDLAARRGRITFPRPESTWNADVVTVAVLAKEFGELVTALAPALADGSLNDADMPLLRRIVAEGDDLIASTMAAQHVARALLQKPKGER